MHRRPLVPQGCQRRSKAISQIFAVPESHHPRLQFRVVATLETRCGDLFSLKSHDLELSLQLAPSAAEQLQFLPRLRERLPCRRIVGGSPLPFFTQGAVQKTPCTTLRGQQHVVILGDDFDVACGALLEGLCRHHPTIHIGLGATLCGDAAPQCHLLFVEKEATIYDRFDVARADGLAFAGSPHEEP